jgi:DNA-directed RNA polymerase subunit RPC12/RpoP
MPLADIICPHCGQTTRVNVPALPPNAYSDRKAVTPCKECSKKIAVTARTDGTHSIKKAPGFIGKTLKAAAVVGAIGAVIASSNKK